MGGLGEIKSYDASAASCWRISQAVKLLVKTPA
jgi:hypothetical protein